MSHYYHSSISYSLPSPPALVGNLEINSLLEKTEILYEHELSGPETIIFHKGDLLAIL